jgi:DNA-binding LacI/PurR family transcriptional regulator
VLNDRCASIPQETQQRVLDAASRLRYRPHLAARALATGRTRRLGIVLNQPESFSTHDSYFAEVLAGIIQRATEHDRNVLLLSAHYPGWHSLFADITGGAVDGVLQISRFVSDELTPALLGADFPLVCVSFHTDDPRSLSVDCDNVQGGYLAAQHLVGLGHSRLALLYPGDQLSWGLERHEGVRRALTDAGLGGLDVSSLTWDERSLPDPVWVREAVDWLAALEPRPTGLVCCDEIRARMVAEMLPSVGLLVPDDISVVSFNSTDVSERCSPPLTSVGQPLQEIGRAAVDQLLRRIREQPVDAPVMRFPMALDIRQSTTAPRPSCGGAVSHSGRARPIAAPANPSREGARKEDAHA